MKKKLILFLLLAVVSAMTGCSENESEEKFSSEEMAEYVPFVDDEGFAHAIFLDTPGEVKVYAFSEGKNYQKVIDKFHEITKDTLQTTLTFQFAENIMEEQRLQMSSKSDVDLIYDAFWLNSSKNLANGMYADLTPYFNNPSYPGLQTAFPPNVVESIRYTDGKIYGIPYYASYNSLNCIYYREDWREKLGLPEIVDEDTFYQYLEGLSEHADELGIISPIGLGERGWFYFGCQDSWRLDDHIYEVEGTGVRNTQNMYVLLDEDNTTVLDASMVGDVHHDFSLWPDGENPMNQRTIELGNKWYQFVNDDAFNNDGVKEQFYQGLYGAMEDSFWGTTWIEQRLKSVSPEAKVGCYFYDDSVRNMDKVSYDISLSNNYMYVPYYCNDIDRTMAVVDWVFESQANNDLFTLGIEGEDWIPVGKKQYKRIGNNEETYSFPEWLWSLNPTYRRLNADEPGIAIKYMTYAADADNFVIHPFAGMSFKSTNIEIDNAALIKLQNDYYHQFMIGCYGEDTEAKLYEFGDRAAEYIEVMRAEVMEQIQEYLDIRLGNEAAKE